MMSLLQEMVAKAEAAVNEAGGMDRAVESGL